MDTAACAHSATTRFSSPGPKDPALLLRICMAAALVPCWVVMGMHNMLSVWYPVRLSTSGLNRESAYASGILIGAPAMKHSPAIPALLGKRLSVILAPPAPRESRPV